jgi:hypothetical protein
VSGRRIDRARDDIAAAFPALAVQLLPGTITVFAHTPGVSLWVRWCRPSGGGVLGWRVDIDVSRGRHVIPGRLHRDGDAVDAVRYVLAWAADSAAANRWTGHAEAIALLLNVEA